MTIQYNNKIVYYQTDHIIFINSSVIKFIMNLVKDTYI